MGVLNKELLAIIRDYGGREDLINLLQNTKMNESVQEYAGVRIGDKVKVGNGSDFTIVRIILNAEKNGKLYSVIVEYTNDLWDLLDHDLLAKIVKKSTYKWSTSYDLLVKLCSENEFIIAEHAGETCKIYMLDDKLILDKNYGTFDITNITENSKDRIKFLIP